ncbi:MAG: septum formation initiator family protein [Bacteroidaceae bacterium]
MSRLLSIWNFVRQHKYAITIAAFVLVAGFLDEDSYLQRIRNKREILHLEREIEHYQAEYDESTRRLNDLMTSPDALEKVAREKYRMKKPNEDIYVFESDNE